MAITRVQSGIGADGDAATSVSKAFAGNVTAGNFLIITCNKFDPSFVAFAAGNCTKSAGTATIGTVAMVPQAADGATGANRAAIFYCYVTGSGSCTMQVAGMTAGSYSVLGIAEYSGLVASSPLEANSATNGSASGAAATGSMTSAGGALYVGAIAVGTNTQIVVTYTPYGAGYAVIFEEGNGLLHGLGSHIDDIVTTGTSQTAAWTLTGSTIAVWAACGAVFTAAASATGSYFHQPALDGLSSAGQKQFNPAM